MKTRKVISNVCMFGSMLYLGFRLFVLLAQLQPAEGTALLSAINQLTVIALIALVLSFIYSKLYIKEVDRVTTMAQTMSLTVITIIGLCVLFFIFSVLRSVGNGTLFDGYQF